MKKTVLKILVVALMFTGYTSSATERDPFLKARGKGSKEFALFIDNLGVDLKNTLIYLRDENGGVLYKENLSDGKEYKKLFDLTALPQGNYILEIEDGTRTKSYPLKITDFDLEIDHAHQSNFYKPQIVAQQNNRVGISLFNVNEKDVELNIYNNNRESVFQEMIPGDIVLQRKYDLSELEPGYYTMSFKVGKRVFSKSVEVK
ncbi:hypothetical protein FNH22_01425 [Fulvivirga sp. M361]|uniref:hypothetical protein n=1 Tax=Fulvivirga sp. M361 TaxID=2594266 RepID=UPI00117B303A|nr:hypothetical protein [Fulvivirga sp. M361]TRX62784.1 hypothetical protein FNH22_01425 [Fulvivirga sp. M361]